MSKIKSVKIKKRRIKHEKKRRLINLLQKRKLKNSLLNFKKKKIQFKDVQSIIDSSTSKGIIHKNKAKRLKSKLSTNNS